MYELKDFFFITSFYFSIEIQLELHIDLKKKYA